jgi:hypothetical protein
MEGRIGGLFKDNNQIGGFTDWKFELLLASLPDEKYKFAKWKLESPAYWLFTEPDEFVVRLYHDIGDSYWEGEGKIISKIQSVFDTMIHERIEIIGEGTLGEHRASSLSS